MHTQTISTHLSLQNNFRKRRARDKCMRPKFVGIESISLTTSLDEIKLRVLKSGKPLHRKNSQWERDHPSWKCSVNVLKFDPCNYRLASGESIQCRRQRLISLIFRHGPVLVLEERKESTRDTHNVCLIHQHPLRLCAHLYTFISCETYLDQWERQGANTKYLWGFPLS